jgi:hypothetical protein
MTLKTNRLKHWTFLALMMVPAQLFAYKFICNGMDSDGRIRADHCGECTEETGPRWASSQVPVHVDYKTLPKGVTVSVWRDAVSQSLRSWNTVKGSSLRLLEAGETKVRAFGKNNHKHEIFWITSKEEWRRQIGGGEHSALGVTVAPYACPTFNNPTREIVDADLVMNGVGGFKWALECEQEGDDCQSIRGTLTHELGHFVGIDHPCPQCAWSLMSAMAGLNVQDPLFDDQQALRALYSDNSTGELGMHCKTDSDCNHDLKCAVQNKASYCAQACGADGSCPPAFRCDSVDGMCKFANGTSYEGAKLGEDCTSLPCEDGLICAGAGADTFVCHDPCSADTPCKEGQQCMPTVGSSIGACIAISGLGEPCGPAALCSKDLACVMTDKNAGACRALCTPGKKKECDDGQICRRFGAGKGACVPKKIRARYAPGFSTANTQAFTTPLEQGMDVDERHATKPASAMCACMDAFGSTSPMIGFLAALMVSAVLIRRREA